MDGSEGPRAQSTRALPQSCSMSLLRSGCGTSDFRPSRSRRDLIEAGVSRKKRAEVIDQHAAAFILQGALDRLVRIVT
jgi:putative Holliday junction resolvase